MGNIKIKPEHITENLGNAFTSTSLYFELITDEQLSMHKIVVIK